MTVLIRSARPAGFPDHPDDGPLDILVADGRVAAVGQELDAPADAEIVDGRDGWVSPGWADLHAHVYHGGTDISIRPSQGGLAHGVTTIVDAGSAGEGNFVGFREFIAEPAAERVVAFLNIGSIGLVACNRVSELIDQRSIDITRTLAVIEANRDIIRGIKCRACSTVTGAWGITPVKIAKKVAKIIRDEGPKGVKAQVQGDELRVSSKSRDDLQAVIALLKGKDFEIALQFTNYR